MIEGRERRPSRSGGMHETMCALLCLYFINKAFIHLCFVDNLLGKGKKLWACRKKNQWQQQNRERKWYPLITLKCTLIFWDFT
jgi:hypothetical protein